MSKYSVLINKLKPVDKIQADRIYDMSLENHVIYVMKYLKDNNIPLTFTYICVAAYKLFPEKFYFDEEFKEFPHIEKLNRTINMHLRPKESGYATGSVRLGYELTKKGEEVAKIVSLQMTSNIIVTIKKKVVDSHKKSAINEYNNLINSKAYSKWLDGNLNDMDVWDIYQVTPFTQAKMISERLNLALQYSNENKIDSEKKFLEYLITLVRI